MISAFLIQQERRRGRRFLRQRDGAPEVGDDLVSAGLRPSSAETRSRGKTVEVCGRAAVEKSSQISPKTSVYIGGREGALPWGSRSPKGVGRAKGGKDSPPNRVLLGLVGVVLLSFPTSSFFSFLFDFLPMAHTAFLGCLTSPLRAGVPPPRPMGFPGVGCPPGELPEPIRHSQYIPGNSENLPVIK